MMMLNEDDEPTGSGSSESGEEEWDDGSEEEDSEWFHQAPDTFSFPDSYHKENEEQSTHVYFPRWALYCHDFCNFIFCLLFVAFLALDGNFFGIGTNLLEKLWRDSDIMTLLSIAVVRVGVCCVIFPLFFVVISVLRVCNGGYHLYHPEMKKHFLWETWRERASMCVLCGICLVASFFSAYVASLTTPVAVQTVISVVFVIPLYIFSLFRFKETVSIIKFIIFGCFFTGVLLASFNEDRNMETIANGDKVGGIFCSILSPLFFTVFLANWRKANPRPRSQYTTHLSLSVMGLMTLICLSPLVLLCYLLQPDSASLFRPDSSVLSLFGTSALFSCLELWMVGMMLSFCPPLGVAMSLYMGILLEWLLSCRNGCSDGPMKIIGFVLVSIATITYLLNPEGIFPILKKQQIYPDPNGPSIPTLPGWLGGRRGGGGGGEEEDEGMLDLHDDEDFMMFRYQPMTNNR